MVLIPAGEFIFRDGQKRTLSAFTIDRYEVTLAEYSAFLDALPHGDPGRFDHPDQPPAKTGHQPRDWAEVSAAAAQSLGKRRAEVVRAEAIVDQETEGYFA